MRTVLTPAPDEGSVRASVGVTPAFRLEAGKSVLQMLGAERAAGPQAGSGGRAAADSAARGPRQRRQTLSVGFRADDGGTPTPDRGTSPLTRGRRESVRGQLM